MSFVADCCANPPYHSSILRVYQQRGLFADWLDDSVRLAVTESYFAAMDEKCLVKVSNGTPHGRFMQLNWRSGKTTTLRFDQGVSYWGCADKPPCFDNSAPALEQADNLLDLSRQLKVRNHKEFPTQIFVKER